jgi:hypothetical protein
MFRRTAARGMDWGGCFLFGGLTTAFLCLSVLFRARAPCSMPGFGVRWSRLGWVGVDGCGWVIWVDGGGLLFWSGLRRSNRGWCRVDGLVGSLFCFGVLIEELWLRTTLPVTIRP